MRADWITPLFVPGDRPERFAKAAATGTDAIILDLEDAVAPDRKHVARAAIARLATAPFAVPVIVRINAPTTPWHGEDLAALSSLLIAAVMVPKAEDPAHLAALAAGLGGRPLVALIETPRGLAAAREIARAPRVARLAFGSIDFCAALGCAHSQEALMSARSELVLASALHALPPPLDGVTTAFNDDALCHADARHAQALGFGGKLCIHPRQLDPVRRGFAPTPDEILWARNVLASAESGAGVLEGSMIDAPIRSRARRIFKRAGKTHEEPEHG